MPVEDAHRWAAATMELGAVVCTARAPRCEACPVADHCRWRAAGYPEHDGPPRRGQAWAGTDRQVRGRLMAVLREAEGPVPRSALTRCGTTSSSATGASHTLVIDGLVEPVGDDLFALPI